MTLISCCKLSTYITIVGRSYRKKCNHQKYSTRFETHYETLSPPTRLACVVVALGVQLNLKLPLKRLSIQILNSGKVSPLGSEAVSNECMFPRCSKPVPQQFIQIAFSCEKNCVQVLKQPIYLRLKSYIVHRHSRLGPPFTHNLLW